jgi:hypothetical protein
MDQKGDPIRPPAIRDHSDVFARCAKHYNISRLPLDQILNVTWQKLSRQGLAMTKKKDLQVAHPAKVYVRIGILPCFSIGTRVNMDIPIDHGLQIIPGPG